MSKEKLIKEEPVDPKILKMRTIGNSNLPFQNR